MHASARRNRRKHGCLGDISGIAHSAPGARMLPSWHHFHPPKVCWNSDYEAGMTMKNIWILIKAAASSWLDDYAQSMGAALAYYTMFSIAPLLLIVISIAGLLFGMDAARGEIMLQLQGLMGQQ